MGYVSFGLYVQSILGKLDLRGDQTRCLSYFTIRAPGSLEFVSEFASKNDIMNLHLPKGSH